MQFPRSRILIFAKAPVAGRVKTRLIPALGPQAAARLYREMLNRQFDWLLETRIAPLSCLCAPDCDHPLFRALEHRGVELQPQQGKDLGQRMYRAAQLALEHCESVLLIGGDCPVLAPWHLRQALEWLRGEIPAVVAPAEDGGYVLLGLRRVDPALFSDIPWGGDSVLDLTRQRLARLGWRYRELPLLWDVDRPEDLDRFHSLLSAAGADAPDYAPAGLSGG